MNNLWNRSVGPFDEAAVQRHRHMGLLDCNGDVNADAVNFLAHLCAGLFFDALCDSYVEMQTVSRIVLQVLSVVLFSSIAEGIRCDYGMQGILFISAFYICRNHRIYQVLLFLLAYMGATGNQPPLCTLLAGLLILLYNGKRGKLKLKYFFYVFYPAHILALYLIQVGLGKYLLK